MAFVSSLPVLATRPLGLHPKQSTTQKTFAASPPRRPARIHMQSTSASATNVATKEKRRPGARKGFVEEMRFVAMRLHTKDQAPREGKQEESALPISEWRPKQQDFLQFLVDSLHVYEYFEEELVPNGGPLFARFRDTGLERCEAIRKDIAWMKERGYEAEEPSGAAVGYVGYLKDLVATKPESVLCHWYNYYFAHTAGGRMIGRMMQDMLFEGRQFCFYEWGTDVKEILGEVRKVIDEVAKDWPRDVKDECLKETGLAFGYSGTILNNLAKAGEMGEEGNGVANGRPVSH